MDAPAATSAQPSVGELFGRLAEDGKAYVRAEVGLYRTIAMRRVGQARNGAIALVAAVFLVNAALIALMVGLALQLGEWIGPALGGLVVFLVIGVIGFLLVRYGAARLGALGGDEDERSALAAAENKA